jgi:hypothetical protein
LITITTRIDSQFKIVGIAINLFEENDNPIDGEDVDFINDWEKMRVNKIRIFEIIFLSS